MVSQYIEASKARRRVKGGALAEKKEKGRALTEDRLRAEIEISQGFVT